MTEATQQKHYQVSQLLKSPAQVIISLSLVAVCAVQIPFVYLAREQKAKYLLEVPEGYHFPQFSDFKGSLLPMLGFLLFE